MKKQYISQDGLKKLKEELENLKTVKLKKIKEQYQQAVSYGDTSENSELDQVKQDKRMLERRIRYLENVVREAVLIDDTKLGNGQVVVGSEVEFEDIKTKKVISYKIVGISESAPSEGKISNESPMGRAFLGKSQGDTVEVEAPSGQKIYKVLKVS